MQKQRRSGLAVHVAAGKNAVNELPRRATEPTICDRQTARFEDTDNDAIALRRLRLRAFYAKFHRLLLHGLKDVGVRLSLQIFVQVKR